VITSEEDNVGENVLTLVGESVGTVDDIVGLDVRLAVGLDVSWAVGDSESGVCVILGIDVITADGCRDGTDDMDVIKGVGLVVGSAVILHLSLQQNDPPLPSNMP
jgi:hypothetical protein